MKIGLVTADPRKTCWKTYMYHGIIMRCRVSCEPGPWWYGAIYPPPPPTFIDYNANVFPDDFSPPFVLSHGHDYEQNYLSGGWYYQYLLSYRSGYDSYVEWRIPQSFWSPHYRIEMKGGGFEGPYNRSDGTSYYSTLYFMLMTRFDELSWVITSKNYKYYGGSWHLRNYQTSIHPGGTFPPLETLYVDLVYSDASNETSIDVCGYQNIVMSGKVAIQPKFQLNSGSFGGRVGIDYFRFIDLS